VVKADGVNNSPQILPAGAWTRFHAPTSNGQILARVGVSFKNVAQACANAEREIPDFDFHGTLRSAEAAWRDKLSVLEIEAGGASDELQTVFWSGVYRSMISPSRLYR
jgi:putative alpha-1,2-mannosidase